MFSRIFLPFLLRALKSVGTAALSPVLEKDVMKTVALESPLVLSMSRLIAMAFSGVMLKDFWHTGVNGWPDATLGIATVLALPVMNVMGRADPGEVVEVARLLLGRLGAGAPRAVETCEPSKFDDHRD